MICPVCADVTLRPVELETGLYFRECPSCRGHWLPSFNYHNWRAMHGPSLPMCDDHEAAPAPPPAAVAVEDIDACADEPNERCCPECGTRLTPYAVGHGVHFDLDHCGVCGGTWFDADEWAVLRRRNLHDDVHRIFMATWQSSVQKAKPADLDRRYERLLGEDDFRRLRRFRAWLDTHPQRSSLIAYLRHEPPS